MSDVAIKVEGLGKRYKIGRLQRHDTLRDRIGESRLFSLFKRRNGNELSAKGNGQRAESKEPRVLGSSPFALSASPADTFWALKDVSFEVKRGEVVGIIGRNGAGKSTLLKILSRITEPTEGYADIHGRIASLLEVGTGFHPELTGRENIFLNGSIMGMKRVEIKKKFDEIVAFAEVEKFIDTPVKYYSSGMYVRLAFAVAAHLDPEILLVDEVLAVGDAAFQKKCLGKMGDVAREGRTVLFVSHNMAAIEDLCQRGFLIAAGQLQMDGEPSAVVTEYLSDAKASLEGVFDYSSHPARSPQYRPVIEKVVLQSTDGRPTSSFYPNDDFQVVLFIRTPETIRAPRIACAIEDHLSRRIMTVASFFQTPLPDIDGVSQIICTIPRLSLGSGRYLLSVSIGTQYGGLLDSIDGGAWFEVGWRNNYGNGESYAPIYGPVLCESTWEKIS